ncbi:MAG TPA: acetylxylan esterase [Bryobacteraceae bacterium]|nr:acetylxylan esterase [Bryobacteraceae bacterium]
MDPLLKLLAASLLAAAGLWAQTAPARFPENAGDSESVRDQQYRQMDRYFDQQIASAAAAREKYWSRLDFSSPREFERSADAYRKDWAQYLGVPEAGGGPLNVQRTKVKEFDTYTAWRVWFDTVPGVQAYGILLIPKKPSGPKPALICVHGHQGTPEIVAGFLPEEALKGNIYRVFGRTAVLRDYVVWCPMILGYYSEEHTPQEGPQAQGRDLLHKKALLTSRTLMGLEVAKLRRAVDYLQTLPEVDRGRIGIYGLSKGGHYTLYAAGIEARLRAVVVSGWFNERTKKLTHPKSEATPAPFLTRIHRSEYYLPGLLDRFGDAELAWMIAPRPLMIEAGTKDNSVNIDFAREEFQRVRQVYGRLGAADRAEFAPFEGPHQIDGTRSFPFLDRWLKQAAPSP